MRTSLQIEYIAILISAHSVAVVNVGDVQPPVRIEYGKQHI